METAVGVLIPIHLSAPIPGCPDRADCRQQAKDAIQPFAEIAVAALKANIISG
jgi:hypothetical protein